MRTIRMMAMVMMSVVLTAGFAVADGNVDVRNDISTNNTQAVNTNAAANSNATGGNVDFKNSNITPIQPYNPTALAPIQTGAALTIGEWGLYLPIFFEAVTMKQSVSLSRNYYGFFTPNRIGDEAIMTEETLAPSASIVIAKYWGKMGNDQYVASFPVFGKRGDQLEGLIGLATKRAMELGANKVGIMIRVIKEINTKGLSVGAGAGAGLYIPCNSGVGTGVSFGAYVSNTKTQDMYELNVICLRGGVYEPPVVAITPPRYVSPPVIVERPSPPVELVCDWRVYERRIIALKEAVRHCKKPCLNNELLRKQIGDAYVQWFNCTGKTNLELLHKASEHYAIGERDFLNGREPDGMKTRNMHSAQELVYQIRYNWSWCVYMLNGYDHAMTFAGSKNLNSAPENFEELKF